MWSGTKTHRRTGPPVLTTPNTGKRGEKRAEGGNELDTRQGVGSSAHLKLDKGTVLTAGMASRRGTRLSSIDVLEHRAPHHTPPRGHIGPPDALQATLPNAPVAITLREAEHPGKDATVGHVGETQGRGQAVLGGGNSSKTPSWREHPSQGTESKPGPRPGTATEPRTWADPASRTGLSARHSDGYKGGRVQGSSKFAMSCGSYLRSCGIYFRI